LIVEIAEKQSAVWTDHEAIRVVHLDRRKTGDTSAEKRSDSESRRMDRDGTCDERDKQTHGACSTHSNQRQDFGNAEASAGSEGHLSCRGRRIIATS
jgi:hypothetical protein